MVTADRRRRERQIGIGFDFAASSISIVSRARMEKMETPEEKTNRRSRPCMAINSEIEDCQRYWWRWSLSRWSAHWRRSASWRSIRKSRIVSQRRLVTGGVWCDMFPKSREQRYLCQILWCSACTATKSCRSGRFART